MTEHESACNDCHGLTCKFEQPIKRKGVRVFSMFLVSALDSKNLIFHERRESKKCLNQS